MISEPTVSSRRSRTEGAPAGPAAPWPPAPRRNPHLRHRVASVAVLLPQNDRVFLIDATPDLPARLAEGGESDL